MSTITWEEVGKSSIYMQHTHVLTNRPKAKSSSLASLSNKDDVLLFQSTSFEAM